MPFSKPSAPIDPFNPKRDTILATYKIGADEGVVTDFIDPEGQSVKVPYDAVEAVGYILQGPNAGKWQRFETKPEEWTKVAKA